MTAGPQLLPGTELAGYEVELLIGRGGMGEVYRARDRRLDRPVALKVLTARLAEDDAFRERLTRESRLAAAIDHPHVVPVYEAGEADGRIFIAMRYVEGTDLRAVRRREGKLEPRRALEIVAQLGEALDAAHERGLVHRDVKPSNCLIDERGNCYLADFGLTQSPAERERPAEGQLMGTVDYVAPEQIRGDEVDGRADVYSLGCVLYECLTGESPFRRPSDVATLFAHLEEQPPAVSAQRAELPRALDAVLSRALAIEPAERYSTCGELVDDARAALGLAAVPRRSRRLVALAITGAMLAAAAVAALLILTGGGSNKALLGSLIRIDPVRNAVAARYPVSAHPGVIATAAGRVWVGDFREGVLYRLEPNDGVLTRVSSTGEPRDLAGHGDSVYVASDSASPGAGTVTEYDAVTGVRRAGGSLLACSIGAGAAGVWVGGCPLVQRLAARGDALRPIVSVAIPEARQLSGENSRTGFHEVDVGGGAVWVLGDMVERRLWKLAPTTGRLVATIALPFPARTLAVGAGAVWVTDPIADVVVRIDPSTYRVVARIPVARGASGVAVAGGTVWVTSFLAGTVTRIDAARNRVVTTIHVAGSPHDVAVGAGGVWVSADAR